jgi:putative transposase
MSKKKKHSRAEIASKLARANDLATQGKLQSEIARALGVSVMTLHRWRKAPHGSLAALGATQQTNRGSLSALGTTHAAGQTDGARGAGEIAELQLENSRLRRLVTDLLLDKIKLEEGA